MTQALEIITEAICTIQNNHPKYVINIKTICAYLDIDNDEASDIIRKENKQFMPPELINGQLAKENLIFILKDAFLEWLEIINEKYPKLSEKISELVIAFNLRTE